MEYDLPADAETVDYKAAPHEVLEAVNRQLQAIGGYRVHMIDTGGDDYAWVIGPETDAPTT
ncbi:hypothetical protein [Enterovirga sp. CN4-39]|uniref:hypothetical protein n=1 Tax=Enterovirga sp. CN4-39 TaxID=3400910 RepID=UPI003C0421F8